MRLGQHQSARTGKALTLFAMLLPVLLAFAGLVIDAGHLLNRQREAHNAADAAALAYARALLDGKTSVQAKSEADAVFAKYTELAGATVTYHYPPATGPYSGDTNYVEVIVTKSVNTWIMRIFDQESNDVAARAVAGTERHPSSYLNMALNPIIAPGLSIVGTSVTVDGPIAVNAEGSGFDEDGNFQLMTNPLFGSLTGLTGRLYCTQLDTVGGVDFPNNYLNVDGSGTNVLEAFGQTHSDPFLFLETPTTSNGVIHRYPGVNGALFGTPQNVVIATLPGTNVTLSPGIYSSISIAGIGPATVTFEPGIYVFVGGLPTALTIATTATVQAEGVMFYNTGSNYDSSSGLPDSDDGNTLEVSLLETFGAITIEAPNGTFSGLDDVTSPFDGMLVYQRRRNILPVTLDADSFDGTVYARWAPTTVLGPGSFQLEVVAGNIVLERDPLFGALTISEPTRRAKGRFVYLVE